MSFIVDECSLRSFKVHLVDELLRYPITIDISLMNHKVQSKLVFEDEFGFSSWWQEMPLGADTCVSSDREDKSERSFGRKEKKSNQSRSTK